jgi:hypothetical protein
MEYWFGWIRGMDRWRDENYKPSIDELRKKMKKPQKLPILNKKLSLEISMCYIIIKRCYI